MNVQFFVSEKELWDLVEDLITPLCWGVQLAEGELSVCDKLKVVNLFFINFFVLFLPCIQSISA